MRLDAEYLNFPVLLRMLQGLAAGQLDIGMLGSTPTIRNLSQPNPAIPIAIAGGGIKFPLQVPPGSPIKKLDDLKGKTVLTIVGSDLHLVLNLMLQAQFGTDDPKALGITVKNIQAFAELTRAQPGIDAVLNVEPAAQGAVNSGRARQPPAQRRHDRAGLRRPGRQRRGPQDRELRQDAVRAGSLLPASHLVGGARRNSCARTRRRSSLCWSPMPAPPSSSPR